MPYINSVERVGHQKGLVQGRQEGRQAGELATRRAVAQRSLEAGLSLEQVAQILAITPADVSLLLQAE